MTHFDVRSISSVVYIALPLLSDVGDYILFRRVILSQMNHIFSLCICTAVRDFDVVVQTIIFNIRV